MTTDINEPSEATTLPLLLRLQMRRAHPLLPTAQVAERIGLSRRLLYSWVTGERTPGPKALREVLDRLHADDATVAAALLLLSSPGGQ